MAKKSNKKDAVNTQTEETQTEETQTEEKQEEETQTEEKQEEETQTEEIPKLPKYIYGSVAKKIATEEELITGKPGEDVCIEISEERQKKNNILQKLVDLKLIVFSAEDDAEIIYDNGKGKVGIQFTELGRKTGMIELVKAFEAAGYKYSQHLRQKMKNDGLTITINNRRRLSPDTEPKILKKWVIKGVNPEALQEAQNEISGEPDIFGITPRKSRGRQASTDKNSAAFDFL